VSGPVVDDRPTIGERYGLAIGASNLRVGERHGGADMVLAAGMQDHRLGVILLRLQSEYDTVRGDLERAGEIAKQGDVEARRLKGAELAEQSRRTREEILTARCLILIHLKTLDSAKRAVAAFAIRSAMKQRFMARNEVVVKLAGRVLDVWLDPTCHVCDGTGWVSSGYHGTFVKACDACNGTGNRRENMGTNEASRWFAFLLMGNLQREMAVAAAGIGRKLRVS